MTGEAPFPGPPSSAAAPPVGEAPFPGPSSADAAPPVGEAWEAVLSAALVGTARRGAPSVAAEMVAALTGAGPRPHRRATAAASTGEERRSDGDGAGPDPAGVLLAAAAVLSSYRRAGRRPGEAPRALPVPAGADDRPACPKPAVEVLELILTGEVPIPGGTTPLVAEWVAGAARAGCRLPARLLPRLLDLGSSSPDLQPGLRAAAGPRGRWLAARAERWSWAAAEPADDAAAPAADAAGPAAAPAADSADPVDAAGPAADGAAGQVRRRFSTAGRADRAALLEAVRRRDPGRGRDLLASTWRRDPAADRAALLGLLAVGLSDDDEPFLEAALDDRSSNVRAIAAELLARLPHSRRSARMADRLRPLVSVAGGDLTVARPAPPDAAARRDGVTDDAPPGMGRSAWWLAQLVAGAPLSFWENEFGLGPAELLARAAGVAELLGGLEYAVVAQVGTGRADPGWAQAMVTHRPTPAVLGALPGDLAAAELAGLVARGLAPRPNVAELFAACPGPWPAPLADAVLDRYRQLGARAALETASTLPVLATRLDPAALPLVETWLFTLAGEPALRRRVQSLAHALSLRAVIHREFPS